MSGISHRRWKSRRHVPKCISGLMSFSWQDNYTKCFQQILQRTLHLCANTMQHISPINTAWPKSRPSASPVILPAHRLTGPPCEVKSLWIKWTSRRIPLTHLASELHWPVSLLVHGPVSHAVLMKRERDTASVWALHGNMHVKHEYFIRLWDICWFSPNHRYQKNINKKIKGQI